MEYVIILNLTVISMVGHTIYEHEIKSVMDAANQLFSPQEGGGDDRAAFQTIYHIMDEVRGRSW
jgi:hypothetical protein